MWTDKRWRCELRNLVLALLLVCGAWNRGFGEVRLPKALSDHAVFQRGVPIHIWGWAAPMATLNVTFHFQTLPAIADKLGRWSAWLMPESAGGPFTLAVREEVGGPPTTISDVLVGDVWLASGQSNMEMPLKGYIPGAPILHGAEEIKAATHAQIRLLRVVQTSSEFPMDDVTQGWTTCNPETAAEFSAVAYFFGKELEAREHVPIGLIQAAWGGVPVDSFVSLQGLSSNASGLAAFANRARFAAGLTDRDLLIEMEQREDAVARQSGKAPPDHAWHASAESWLPAGPYNGMIAPLTKYTLKGFLWYQGESDTALDRAVAYKDMMRLLILDWRNNFARGELPFLYVQIASFHYSGGAGMVRDAQRRALALVNTAMVVTLDVGDANNIHPADKQTVGERLAAAARGLVYGENVPYQPPLLREVTSQPGALRVWFDHAEGLQLRGGTAGNFEIAGADHHFKPAEARVEGESVVVSGANVIDPQYVRYGWSPVVSASLFNSQGLPASTFSSEPVPTY